MTAENPIPPEATAVPPVQPDYSAPAGVEMNKDAKLWGMLAHLSALAGLVIPFGFVIGPLVFGW